MYTWPEVVYGRARGFTSHLPIHPLLHLWICMCMCLSLSLWNHKSSARIFPLRLNRALDNTEKFFFEKANRQLADIQTLLQAQKDWICQNCIQFTFRKWRWHVLSSSFLIICYCRIVCWDPLDFSNLLTCEAKLWKMCFQLSKGILVILYKYHNWKFGLWM